EGARAAAPRGPAPGASAGDVHGAPARPDGAYHLQARGPTRSHGGGHCGRPAGRAGAQWPERLRRCAARRHAGACHLYRERRPARPVGATPHHARYWQLRRAVVSATAAGSRRAQCVRRGAGAATGTADGRKAGMSNAHLTDKQWLVEIKFTRVCNRRCKFCPVHSQPAFQGAQDFLTPALDDEIGRQLGAWVPQARLEFTMRGEPTLNPQAAECIAALREHLPRSQFSMFTNGTTWLKDDSVAEAMLDA